MNDDEPSNSDNNIINFDIQTRTMSKYPLEFTCMISIHLNILSRLNYGVPSHLYFHYKSTKRFYLQDWK